MTDPASPSSKLILYRGWLDTGKHVWSPFVIKLEARLRFAGVSYKTEVGSVRSSPKGKIPYVKCRGPQSIDNGEPEFLSDSSLIIKQLVEWEALPDLNEEHPSSVGAHDLALRAMLEDRLYFYHTWERWVMNYYAMRDHILSALPFPVRFVVGNLIYRNTVKTLHGQGTSRYTADEIQTFRLEIWESFNALLVSAKKTAKDTSRPFWLLGGEEPTEADASLFGFITSVLICTACPDSQQVVKGFPILLEYAGRIHDAYFPDYQKWS